MDKCKNCDKHIEQGLLGWYHVGVYYTACQAEPLPDESATEETIQFREEETYEGAKHPILLMPSGLFMFEKPEALPKPKKKEPVFNDPYVSYKFSYGISPPHGTTIKGMKVVKTSGKMALELTRKPNKDGK